MTGSIPTLDPQTASSLSSNALFPRSFPPAAKSSSSPNSPNSSTSSDCANILHSWSCFRIDGSVKSNDRQSQIEAFISDPECRIFLLSTRAGGLGINLTAADTVILFDNDWNPQRDLQAQDRAHRIGQTKPVIIYRIASKGTVEESLLDKFYGKRCLEKLAIQKDKFLSLPGSKLLQQRDQTKTAAADNDHAIDMIGSYRMMTLRIMNR
ncbi:hypothetical protein MMC31_002629 [Peltigera leucophlebia]|nr:hypothetical protein [Peltigera leucophlebia]